jgi:tetratricopeptide (TPR) repeat protein
LWTHFQCDFILRGQNISYNGDRRVKFGIIFSTSREDISSNRTKSMLANAQLYKCIFQGRLEFGTEKSFEKILRQAEHQYEFYYKFDVLFKLEDVFEEENFAMNIPRLITQGTEKAWKNTYHLLKYCAEFAVSGSMGGWMTDSGKLLKYGLIEPTGDKVAVQEFLKGKRLSEDPEKLEEAIEALTNAIEKYDRHAQAYERRGHVNFLMKKYHDAERDYRKSVGIDAYNSKAWFGLAKSKVQREAWQEAIEDLELVIKNSLALQPIYWKARRVKAECHMRLNEMEEAAFELRLFTNRKFKEDDPNARDKKRAGYFYGKVLTHLKQYAEALAAFEAIEGYTGELKDEERGDAFLLLGMAKQQTGRAGFLPDWQRAAELGNKQAERLLAEHV